MSIKEKLELLGKNSIRLKIEGKENTNWGPPVLADSPMCRLISCGLLMRARATIMW